MVENDLNYRSWAQEISEGKNFSMWPRDLSCGVLVKIVAVFDPCLKSA